ncbi:hypothetical protein N0V82_009365 [Gnomoniopsis sp. IMI 355080]|nr:hypothetical protein N0V82_009365 [Gnomoniopsis sp. IMI 355080]
MSDMAPTPLQPHQDDGDTVPENGGPRDEAMTASSSDKEDKKYRIVLTPVESRLFFNIVRFNSDLSHVDWAQVASYSNLKNASSAKVRFRQIQGKYGLDFNVGGLQMKRKSRATVTEDEDDEDDEDEDADRGSFKKRFNNPGSRGLVFQSRDSRNSVAAQGDFDDGGSAFAFAATRSPVANPFAFNQQAHSEQQLQSQTGSSIKQESPFSQMQTMEPSYAHRTTSYHHLQQSGHSQQYLSDSANTPYHMGATQYPGVGTSPNMYNLQGTHGIPSPQQSQLFTQQQQAYLQSLQWMYRARTAQRVGHLDPYTQSEPQSQFQDYMTQPGDGPHGHFGDFPITYAQAPQAYIDTLPQSVGSQPLAQGPTQAAVQSPATTMADDNPNSSQDFGSLQSAPESPYQSIFDELIQMPDSAASPTDTTAEPAGRAETLQGGEEYPTY